MPLPILAIAALAAAGVKAYIGARQQARAKKLAAQNTRPDFDIQKEYFTNRDLAANAAQSGLPQATLNYATQNMDRALGSNNSAVLQAGGGPNAIGANYDQYNQGQLGLAATDAQARASNINRLMQANNDLASQRTMAWSLNKQQPYLNRAAEAAQLRATGTQNINSAINEGVSAAANYETSRLYSANNGNLGSSAASYNFAPGTASSDAQVNAMNARSDYQVGQTFGNPNLAGTDPSAQQSNQLINDALQNNMELSPYQDLIRRRLQQQYGSFNQGYLGTTA